MSTKRWVGNAASVSDLWTIVLSGTVTSQTYTLTINGKSLSYTSTGGDTVATILAILVTLWNQTSPSNPPEFQELVASGVGTVGALTGMIITGKTPGNPSTISVATGGAATFTITNTTPATGPNDFANAQNWSGGVAPANSDTLVYDNGSVDCLFNLTTTLTGIVVIVNPGYSGKIGLPFINANSQVQYAEYRTTSLTLAGGTVTINAPLIQRCNVAFGAHLATVRVLATGQRLDKYTPVVLLIGGNGSSELDITKGDVATSNYLGTTADFPVVNTSFSTNAPSDVTLNCGAGTTLGVLNQNGGHVTIQSAVTTATLEQAGGVLTIQDGSATTVKAMNGTVNVNTTGTIATIDLYNSATLNFDSDTRAKTVTNPIAVYSNAVTIVDTQHSVNSGTLTLATNGVSSPNVQRGVNSTIVYT